MGKVIKGSFGEGPEKKKPLESKAARKDRERLHKKQVKKAEGMLKRIAIAQKNGDDEELGRVKKEFKAWKEKFKK